MSPAKPRISPLRISKLMSCSSFLVASPSTFSTTSSEVTSVRGRASEETSRPTIMEMISRISTSFVVTVPMYWPSRSTETRSVISSISGIRWEM